MREFKSFSVARVLSSIASDVTSPSNSLRLYDCVSEVASPDYYHTPNTITP